MKKLLKIVLYTVGGIVLAVAITLIVINFRGIPSYEPKQVEFKAEITPARVEQGQRLASMLCKNCHLSEQTGTFSGQKMLDLPPEFGLVYAKNITKHPTAGIGKWSDSDLAYFLRTGIRPDGSYAPIYMPKMANMADEDLKSIIAFLRSDHQWVKETDVNPGVSEPSLLTKVLCTFVFKPLPYPEAPKALPDTNDRIAVGRYIALAQLECYNCHSADFKTNDIMQPEQSIGFFGGGNILLNKQGQEVRSRNLTMDPETGIGTWTEEQFIKAVRFGITPHGTNKYPMEPYSGLSDKEASAIFAYLKTVPMIKNSVQANK